jgi:hypothetical protein
MSESESIDAVMRLKRVLANPGLIKSANRFLFTRVGAELVLDVGFIDPAEMRQAAKAPPTPDGPPMVDYVVTDRFALSPDAAANLFAVAKKIVTDLQAQGVLPDPLNEEDV